MRIMLAVLLVLLAFVQIIHARFIADFAVQDLEEPYNLINWVNLDGILKEKIQIAIIDTGSETEETHGKLTLMLAEQNPIMDSIAKSATLVYYQIEDYDENDGIVGAIHAAVTEGADVISISLGRHSNDLKLEKAIKYADEMGCIIIAAAGNEASDTKVYPAAYGETIAVTAVDACGNYLIANNYGEWIDVSLPGENLKITYDDKTMLLSGSSGSTVLMACVAASIKSCFPEISGKDIKRALQHTSRDLGKKGKDEYYGYGLLDVSKLVGYLCRIR